MDSPVANELAWACAQSAIASLRFSWRGVGASAGRASGDPEPADEDYAAALAGFGGRVLLVTGAADGIAPPRALEEIVAAAREARLAVIPEADHFFVTGLAEVGRVAREWLGGS